MREYLPVFMLPVFLLTGCPDDGDKDIERQAEEPEAAVERLCPINCETIEKCYGLQPDETQEDCVAQCIDWRTEDLDRMGDTCDTLLIELLECQYTLPCDDYEHYHEEGQALDDSCGEEFHEFHSAHACMGGAA